MSIKNRLKAFIEHLGIEVKAFESKAGLSNGFVNNAGFAIRESSLQKILKAYPEINTTWLLTGDGPMVTDHVHLARVPNPRIEAIPVHLASEPDLVYDQKFTDLGDGTISMRIPVIRQRAYAGYLRGYEDPEYYEDAPTMTIDVYKEHKGNYLAFEVVGDSMTTYDPREARQSIYDGYFVVGREVQRQHWKYKLHTHYVDSWIIVHQTEGILIKKIINHDVENGIITIHSLNPDKNLYPDQDLYLEEVQQIFNIVQKIDKM